MEGKGGSDCVAVMIGRREAQPGIVNIGVVASSSKMRVVRPPGGGSCGMYVATGGATWWCGDPYGEGGSSKVMGTGVVGGSGRNEGRVRVEQTV